MEDVVEAMRRAIVVRPVGPNLAQVSFSYEDPVQAQRVSQDLVGRIIYANLTSEPTRSILATEPRESESSSSHPQTKVRSKSRAKRGLP